MIIVENLPAFIRVLAVFAAVVGAIRVKISLGSAFVLGSVLLGVFFGLDFPAIFTSAFRSLIHPKTLSLSAVVMLILILSHSMESVGQLDRLLETFRGLVRSPGANIAIFPALIGLLPMPGGAIFSAPMVKTLGQPYRLSGAQLSFANYWFRHIWEYWWPLYPGVLLTTGMAGIDLWAFIMLLSPMTIFAVFAGYSPFRGTFIKALPTATRTERKRLLPFLRELTPVSMVVITGLGLGLLLTPTFEHHGLAIGKETGLVLALILAIFWVWRTHRVTAFERWRILRRRDLYRMFYMVSAIMIFQGILKDSHAISALSRELIALRFPLVPMCIILPCLVGLVGGITIAFVGTAFPVLISLIQNLGRTDLLLPYLMLAMTSGFIGVLLSPLHMCLLLSNTYFRTPLGKVYRYLWLPCAALVVAGLIYFWLLVKLIPN